MKRNWILLAAAAWPNALSSEELPWELMQGSEITAALEGRVVEDEGGEWIAFQPDGFGQGSTGTTLVSMQWRVSQNSLCIKPEDVAQWGCYLWVARNGNKFRFVGGPGDVRELKYRQ